jgi:hypothetical protein
MRGFFYVISAILVMALAFWAYRENYKTQMAIKSVESLHHDLGRAREKLVVLRAEWAYLNRPDRLRELAVANFDQLELFPLAPSQFGRIDEVEFPAPDLPPVTNPVEVSGPQEQGQ